jgi:L-serine dehydratase
MSIFDVIGPVMIGPSSSHTAGAAKIGLLARNVYHQPFKKVSISLYNSFADTGPGHGTMQALVGGLLGFSMDDERIPFALDIARKEGIQVKFAFIQDPEKHPNYVTITIQQNHQNPFIISGISIGGGHAKIVDINHNKVEFSGKHDLLILEYRDTCGMVAFVGDLLAKSKINIAYMQISRDAIEERALAVLKLDAPIPGTLMKKLKSKEGIFTAVAIPRWKEDI